MTELENASKAVTLNRDEITAQLRQHVGAIDDDWDKEARQALVDGWERLNDEITGALGPGDVDAEVILERALHSLDRVQAFRSLIEDLLETVKRDESLSNTFQNYRDIGLVPPGDEELREEAKYATWPWNERVGEFLKMISKGLKKLALALSELSIHALKTIPRLAEIGIRACIPIGGPFPSVSFDLDLTSLHHGRGAAASARR